MSNALSHLNATDIQLTAIYLILFHSKLQLYKKYKMQLCGKEESKSYKTFIQKDPAV